MTDKSLKRKLVAILHADVKGYSRLMDDNEEATVSTLTAYREVMGVLIRQHRGRVVHGSGDSLLAEFISVVDAVQCAVEIQEELKTRNTELSEGRKVEFRVGINLGDVIEKDEDLHGDGVNIAARVENLAKGGGICITRPAYDQVKNKLSLGYEYLGEHAVKNIVEPVRVYRVLMEPEAAGKVIGEKKPEPKRGQKVALAVVIILLLVAGGVGIWNFWLRPPESPIKVASTKKMAFALPDKPSIAVLPFVNLSGDPEQEYFIDGITEAIITALSMVPKLFVIARNSTFTYKGKPVKVQQVSEELGVRYVLEGSVRKTGDRLRITAQLIDALNGHHLWAERYDRNIDDIFAVQDEITKKIITAMQVKLTEGEQVRTAAKGTNNLEAYLKCLQANEYWNRFNIESNALAKQLTEEAIALDPEYAWAYHNLARTHMLDVWLGTSKSPKQSITKAMELLQKAIALDETFAEAHGHLGWLFSMTKQHDKALTEGEKAVTLNPNSADSHMRYGKILTFAGRYEESIPELNKAIRLNPIPPNIYLYSLGISYCWTGQYEEAITWCEKAVRREPNSMFAHLFMTMAYSFSGRDEEARIEAAEVIRIQPKFSLEKFAKRVTYKNQEDKERCIGALHKAGLN
ncbi:MAG: adenylate/guanylate cyclase domain-containing protein [Desulfobacterales bacterium]